MQGQIAVTAYLRSKQLLLFSLAWWHLYRPLGYDRVYLADTPEVADTPFHIQRDDRVRDVEPMLVSCWTSVVDVGPALNQYWVSVLCLL